MGFGTRPNPRVEERLRGVSGGRGDELVSRLTEGSIRTKGILDLPGLYTVEI